MNVSSRSPVRPAWIGAALALLASCLRATVALGQAPAPDDALERAIDREQIVRAALAHNPGLKAQGERVRATRAMARAEGRLPDPEAMFQIWQVPFERPVSFGDSQMIMAGVSQSFPAIGSLSARAESRDHTARAEEAMLTDRARDVVRDVEHAYADLTEAVARHETHMDHRAVAAKLVAAAQARQVAGGTLDDVAQADLALARLDADIATEAASIVRAKAKLNGLLGRAFDAPLADPKPTPPTTVDAKPDALASQASQTRPDARAAEARVDAERAALDAAEREAKIPSFSLGAYYFAPTTNMPMHGYGFSASMSLPWLWGGGARRQDVQKALADASRYDAADAKLRANVDVGSAAAATRAATARLRVMRDLALPAAKRALDATLATYASGRGDLMGALRAQQAVVDTEIEIVNARAALDHALADLDAAVGAVLPRTPIDAPATSAPERRLP